jgi:hypothetical protein
MRGCAADTSVILRIIEAAPRLRQIHAQNVLSALRVMRASTTNRSLASTCAPRLASGTNSLRASLERVLRTRQPDTMPVRKYDIRGPDGNFEEKYWSPKNPPVLSATGEVRYILQAQNDLSAQCLS